MMRLVWLGQRRHKGQRLCLHEIDATTPEFGSLRQLFQDVVSNPQKFSFYRMTTEQFKKTSEVELIAHAT